MYAIIKTEKTTGYETLTKSIFLTLGLCKAQCTSLNNRLGMQFGYTYRPCNITEI